MTRACGKCGMCCKLLSVPVLGKSGGAWCRHYNDGCAIYADRPHVCRTFACQWLIDEALGDEWFPLHAKMFMYLDGGVEPNLLRILVDDGYHGRWRESPYRETIEKLSAFGLRRVPQWHTVVQLGRRSWLITPGGETEVTGKASTNEEAQTWR